MPSRAAAGTFPVTGRKVLWVSSLPNNGWAGGSADGIKRLADSLQEPESNKAGVAVLRHMIPFAEMCDLYFINFSDLQTKSDTITVLRIDVSNITDPNAGDFSNEEYRSALAKALAKSVEGAPGARSGEPPDAQIEFVKEATTGNRRALTIGLRASLRDNSAFYDVHHMVVLGDGRWHFFRLTVDADHFTGRFDDLNGMLLAIRYLN